MSELLSALIAAPVLPATVLLGLLVIWSLLALVGGIDTDMSGPDLDMDVDVSGHPNPVDALGGVGVASMRWLNLSNVPLILWAGAFTILFWLISINLWLLVDKRFLSEPGWLWTTLLIGRNLLLTIPATKLATQPMRGWFHSEKLTSTSIIGCECEISSLEASPDFGQVKFKTDGAPLLLNVRTDGPHLAKGARVWITHYDEKRRVYIVSPTHADASTATP